MKNLSIAKRLALMILASLAALLIVGFVGLSVANRSAASIGQINDVSLSSIQVLSAARQTFMEITVSAYAHVNTPVAGAMKELEARIDASSRRLSDQLASYEKLVSGDEDRKMLEADRASLAEYVNVIKTQVLPKSDMDEKDAARNVLTKRAASYGEKTLKAFDDHIAYNDKQAQEAAGSALTNAERGKAVALTVILTGAVAVGLLGFFLSRSINVSLSRVEEMVHRIESDLDFSVRASVQREDEIGRTTLVLNRLLDKLQKNLKSIADGTLAVSGAADRVTASSEEVARASNQRSEAASAIAATIEEMTVSINHIDDRAQEADRISSEAGALATTGVETIRQTVNDIEDIATTVNSASDRMHSLEEHSRRIAHVVAVIKEVADQTNLLALNAAIEAARAGEQGRGFSVVADEVRKLAERTSASTREITDTIDSMRASTGEVAADMQQIVEKVGLGVARAREADGAIKRIGESTSNTTAIVDEISSAIREQSTAATNIAVHIERVAQMSEESGAAAARSADSARELDELASEMKRSVSAYKL